MRELFALVVAAMVGAAVWFGFAIYTWSAIHSGWGESGIQMFYIAMYVVPVVVGLAAGWAAYRA